MGADVIVHEATYMESESTQAAEHFHTTARQAAELAKEACARHLILTHISNRYDDRSAVEGEARSVFSESYVAEDMGLFTLTSAGLRFDGIVLRRTADLSVR